MSDLFQDANDQNGIDENKNYLNELVGPDKKFKDPESLARGKAEADAFILRLQNEQANLRKELDSRMTIEGFLDKMKTDRQPNPNDTNQNQRTNPDEDGNPNRREIDPDKLYDEFKARINKEQAEDQRKRNFETTVSKLKDQFGSGYASKLEDLTKNLGMSKETINRLAHDEPQVLLNLLGQGKETNAPKRDIFSPPASSVNAPNAFRPSSSDRTKGYYENLRKTDPSTYFSPKVQQQEMQDALRLGESFFDT